MYNIGVLGCNGNIGSLFVEKASKCEDNYIYAVSRSDINFIKKDNIEYMFFDAENIEKLSELSSKCDVVVNCTGIDKINIMNECVKNGANYVDPSFVDTEVISRKLIDISDSCIICSAGCNPGLTEVLTKYISIKFNPKMCEIIFSGNGSMSRSAVTELLDLSGEYRSFFRSFIKFKNIEKLEYWDVRRKLNDLCGNVICIPVINKSFLKCVESTEIERVYFYNTFKSEKIIAKLIEAKCMITEDEKKQETIVANLEELFEKEKSYYSSTFTLFQCNFSNKKNEINKESILFESRMDWNSITAIILLEIINLLKHKKNIKYGIGEVWEMFDCCEIIDDFLREGSIELKNTSLLNL